MNFSTLLSLHPDVTNAQQFEQLIRVHGVDLDDVEVEVEEFDQTIQEGFIILPPGYRSVEEMQDRLIWTPDQ